jgi:hypothetical protein
MKKKYWMTDQGILMAGSGNIKFSNGIEISQGKYYKLLKEQKRMSNELDENGITMDSKGNLFFKGIK